ncbi:DUF2786 domain-containing protein [Streptomyces sp. GC420]|uniref:DUF2786 domain-containing protein n=1 Tax=Streptomyces sp. GC420 TaxID=2697568 RepID=UPI0028BE0F68|nr:DUF2786 domain-containing protein [Streptomyces sp. GC420]
MGSARDTVDRAFAAALYAEDDASLDTGASVLAAASASQWPAVGEELLSRGEGFVRTAWERGWQPADVVRLVRRDLDAAHVRVVACLIASEVREYARLDHRWTAQLRDLGADTVPWAEGPDPDFIGYAGRRTSLDRFSLATALLEVLRLLLRLPSLEPVGPVPGSGTAAPAAHGEPKQFGRIRALLAKAEATGFPEEAEALTAKAQELMARHSVDEALLAAGRAVPGDGPVACRIGVDAPYETAKAILLDAVASANRCRAVWNSGLGFSTVVGFEGDLEAVELLHTSLLVQGMAAMTRAEAGQRAGGRRRTKAFRQSFLLAYAGRIGTRLAEAAEAAADAAANESADAGGGATAESRGAGRDRLLPVLAARDLAVTAETDRLFPETSTTRVRGAYDAAGHHEGTAAADRAGLRARRPLPG